MARLKQTGRQKPLQNPGISKAHHHRNPTASSPFTGREEAEVFPP
jgi:hypothetical protein